MQRFRKRYVKSKQFEKRIRLSHSVINIDSNNIPDETLLDTDEMEYSSSDDENTTYFSNDYSNAQAQLNGSNNNNSNSTDSDSSSHDSAVSSENVSLNESENSIQINTSITHYQNSKELVPATEIEKSVDGGEQNLPTFENALKEWVLECQPNVSHVDKLLKIMNNYPTIGSLPKTYETLVKTPRDIHLRSVPPGKYLHLGLKYAVTKIIDYYLPASLEETIQLDINIDGIPLYKSSKSQFWPILGQVKNIENSSPFLIGIYCGTKKPDSVNLFLEDLINDLKEGNENCLEYKDKNYKIKLRAVICDAPARSYVKCVKSHNGYSSCNFCIQEGIFENSRMCFPETNASVRTNESFRSRIHEDHHLKEGEIMSPFEELDIDMVHSFPLDYMHLLLLGIMKKLLMIWLSGELRVRMSSNTVAVLNNLLEIISKTQSRCFARPSRSLNDLKFWKSSEFRTFLLYTGPVILKNVLPPDLYNNFLFLHIATKICIKDEFKPFLEIAHNLYLDFVKSYEECYGAHLISSNVHNVVHLVECVKRFGNLDNFSAFPFESALGHLKFLIKKNRQELQQVGKRLMEREGILIRKKPSNGECYVTREIIPNSGRFARLNHGEFKYTNDDKDGWFLAKNDKIVKIRYFKSTSNNISINGEELSTQYANFYVKPIESMYFDIYVTEELEKHPKQFQLSDIKMKIFYFSLKESDTSNLKHYFMGL